MSSERTMPSPLRVDPNTAGFAASESARTSREARRTTCTACSSRPRCPRRCRKRRRTRLNRPLGEVAGSPYLTGAILITFDFDSVLAPFRAVPGRQHSHRAVEEVGFVPLPSASEAFSPWRRALARSLASSRSPGRATTHARARHAVDTPPPLGDA